MRMTDAQTIKTLLATIENAGGMAMGAILCIIAAVVTMTTHIIGMEFELVAVAWGILGIVFAVGSATAAARYRALEKTILAGDA